MIMTDYVPAGYAQLAGVITVIGDCIASDCADASDWETGTFDLEALNHSVHVHVPVLQISWVSVGPCA